MRLMRFLPLLLVLLLWGCMADQQEVEYLHGQVYTLNTRVDALEKRLSALERQVAKLTKELETKGTQSSERVETVAARQAELAAEIERLQAEQLRLNGQVEQLSYLQSQDRKAFQEFQAEVLERLARIEASLNRTAKGSKVSKKPAEPTSGEELYQKALELYRQKRYEEAQKLFEEYLRKYPKGKRAANATFWIGECLYQRKLYEEAILQYQKVIDEFPKSSKVPAALLKQGLAFLRLGDTEAAAIVFKKLVRRYPHTEQARLARKYLARMKK